MSSVDRGLINNEAAPQPLTRPENCCYSSASNNRICATMHQIPSSRESAQNFMVSTTQFGVDLSYKSGPNVILHRLKLCFPLNWSRKENHCAQLRKPHTLSHLILRNSVGQACASSFYSSAHRLRDEGGPAPRPGVTSAEAPAAPLCTPAQSPGQGGR